MAGDGLARHSKKANRERRSLIFIDESGLLMAPLVRKTWAPRGRRPVLVQRGRHREKISLAAGIWLSSSGEPERISYRMLVNAYFNNTAVADFLKELVERAGRPLTVVWDGGNMHKGEPIRQLLRQYAGRLQLERLPAYAPMLNPVEHLWAYLKYSRLNNYPPLNVEELKCRATRELTRIQKSKKRMRSFWNACELSGRGH